jgi:hypothetical protein
MQNIDRDKFIQCARCKSWIRSSRYKRHLNRRCPYAGNNPEQHKPVKKQKRSKSAAMVPCAFCHNDVPRDMYKSHVRNKHWYDKCFCPYCKVPLIVSGLEGHINAPCPSLVTEVCRICGIKVVAEQMSEHQRTHDSPKNQPTKSVKRPSTKDTKPINKNSYRARNEYNHYICRQCGRMAIYGNDVCYDCGYE